ncbi:MAG: PfkB family carbohydrate kinase [Desulfobacterales bacterium]|jgi:sugar/nucleoside kinase (ribokinase family)
MLEKGIAVIGSTTIDKNIYDNKNQLKIGGVTTYSGITYRRHGIVTRAVTNVAEQDLPILDKLDQEQITVQNGPTTHTTQFINIFIGDQRRQKLPSTASPIKACQIEALRDAVGCVHLGPLHPLDIEPDCINLLKEAKLPVFLDVQGYTRRIEDEEVYTGVADQIEASLKISRIVKANESEFESVLQYFDIDLAGLLARYHIEEFIVTQGKKGGFVLENKNSQVRFDAVPVQSPGDPTGAGDIFFAAYIIGRFMKKMDISNACTYAAELTALQIRGNYITEDLLGLSAVGESDKINKNLN